ncbi:MAG: phosphate acyltransferase [Isosphaeraceae bacterium]|nr:phosphate acyltransferase [Isosphaeraceae bacterium]
MSLPGFDELWRAADAQRAPVAVVAAGGDDPTVLEALRVAAARGWVVPRVVGPEEAIRQVAGERGIDLSGFTLIAAAHDATGAAAVAEVRGGRARLLMKGRIDTPALMRAVLDPEHGLRTERVIGQFVLMEIPRDGRRFLLTDTGIMVRPDVPARIDLLRSAVAMAQTLGVSRPRVAVMAATETVKTAMPETLDAAELQRRNEQGEISGCDVQGPLSFDLAYAAGAAGAKRIGGPVAGAADILLFPNLLSANLTVKAIMYTADCRYGGVLRGTAAPVVFMSRADTSAVRLDSLALTLALLNREAGPAAPGGA